MKKLKNNIGMTLAEMLMVVAIIGVLCGVAFIAVWKYQRSMGQLERDGIAKEIFVAAQNHLTAAYGEGYLGLGTDNSDYFGTEDTETKDAGGKDIVGDYYYTVNGGSPSAGVGVFEQMLPFGSVDETVRAGGSYIIHYQKDTGLVMDVFYCTRSGSPTRFNVESLGSADYSLAMKARESKENRKTGAWRKESNGPILGYYGGTDAASLPTATLKPPSITVHNEEKLYVEVTNPNKDVEDEQANPIASLQLIIKGVDSKAQAAIILQYPVSNASTGRVITRDFGDNFTVILDDITTSGLHFANLTADTVNSTGNYIPGEDIEIQAVAYSTKALVNIAYSAKSTTNSLFGSINSTKNTAYIGNIRHLENLDKAISNLDANDGNDTNDKIKIDTAEQTDNFSWVDFQKAIRKIETSDAAYESVGVFNFSGTGSTVKDNKGYFMPIQPNYTLTYNGKNHSISDVSVDIAGHAGLFGSTSSVKEISDLELIDFSVVGTTSAGALAGTLENCTVKNVLARNRDNSETSLAKKITATTDAGGLIGKLTSGTVQYSAAAVFVGGSSTTNAGGLIGSASGTIEGCYSGGHTQNGDYKSWVDTYVTSGVKRGYDVNGATAGGLVGSVGSSDAEISGSYSTCSVSGTTVGGFAGSASGSIEKCYATGLVNGTTQFAFVAAGSPSLSGDHFYRVINEVASTKPGAKEGETEPMLPVSGYVLNSADMAKIKPIDLNADTYNEFAGAWNSWNPARAFDSTLMQYYSGSYTLRTVDELIGSEKPKGYNDWNQLFIYTHYGDWPSPEVFFIN